MGENGTDGLPGTNVSVVVQACISTKFIIMLIYILFVKYAHFYTLALQAIPYFTWLIDDYMVILKWLQHLSLCLVFTASEWSRPCTTTHCFAHIQGAPGFNGSDGKPGVPGMKVHQSRESWEDFLRHAVSFCMGFLVVYIVVVVTFCSQGPPGMKGEPGPQGPPGRKVR